MRLETSCRYVFCLHGLSRSNETSHVVTSSLPPDISIAKSLQIESVYLSHLEAPFQHRPFRYRLEHYPSVHNHWPLLTLSVAPRLFLSSLPFQILFLSPSFISNPNLLLVVCSLLPSPQNLFLILHRLVKPFTATSTIAPVLWLLETWSCILEKILDMSACFKLFLLDVDVPVLLAADTKEFLTVFAWKFTLTVHVSSLMGKVSIESPETRLRRCSRRSPFCGN